jgi:ATP synthase protein I
VISRIRGKSKDLIPTLSVEIEGRIMPNGDRGQRTPGEISPEDREALKKRAAEIGAGLDKIKARQTEADASTGVTRGFGGANSRGVGDGFRFVIELLVGIGFGAALGWGLDQLFGTRPWGMIVMTLLGFAAGFWNVIRAAQRADAQLPPHKRNAPAVKDDRSDD